MKHSVKAKYYITLEIKEDYISVLEEILRCLCWINRKYNIGIEPTGLKKIS